MDNELEGNEIRRLLDGLKIDATAYFKRAEKALEGVEIVEGPRGWERVLTDRVERDRYWSELPGEIRSEADRLSTRLVSFMGQVSRGVRNALLSSEADQRDVMTGNKAMRAALHLRHFRSWDTEVINNEDIVLGVRVCPGSFLGPAKPSDHEADGG